MMVLAITTFTSKAQTLDSIVNHLDSINLMAVQISNDPTTSFQRIVVYRNLTHDSQKALISVELEVFLYNNGELVSSKATNSYKVKLNTNRYSYIDSTGAEVPDTTAGAFQEYYYLVDQVKGNGVLFQLIKQNALLSDLEGKFD